MSCSSPQNYSNNHIDANKQKNETQKVTGKKQCLPALLPVNQLVYISSIVNHTFSNDRLLIGFNNDSDVKRNLRTMLVEHYLNLNAHQHILYCALFYLQQYFHKNTKEAEYSKHLPIACLALARKYQKGKAANLDNWKQKLNIAFLNEEICDLEDQIIELLEFQLQPITRFVFMSDLFLVVQLNEKYQHFCSYLLDLSIFLTHSQTVDNAFQFTQAEIGLSVVRLACYFFNPSQLCNLPIQSLNISQQRIHECCSQIFQQLLNRKIATLKQIRHRYRRSKFMQVSKIEFFRIVKPSSQKQTDTADENQPEDKKQKQRQKQKQKQGEKEQSNQDIIKA